MRFVLVLLACSGLLLGAAIQKPAAYPARIKPPAIGVHPAMDYFRTEAPQFSTACQALLSSLQQLPTRDPAALLKARQQLITCRLHYKRIESFLEYFFHISARVYNSPPKYEPEEPDMEYQHPEGMQVIESLLYKKNPAIRKKELLEQAGAVASSASDLTALLYDFHADDPQILESLRLELIRVITLGITGYDAPLLKSGLSESLEALRSLRQQLQPYLHPGGSRSDSLDQMLSGTIAYLGTQAPHPFDKFDRLAFLKIYALPLQHQLGAFITEQQQELNTRNILNYQADNLFSKNALIPENFPGASGPITDSMIQEGKKFFSDRSLSINGKRSCATCHAPEKMFTDRLPTSISMDEHTPLNRNAPTLLYCSYQYQQFWDGRAKTLEDQIKTVLHDPREMNAPDSLITPVIIRCIAAYVRSLHPMNSPFDRYMRGEEKALNAHEKNGANLFMGKAQCATCHFMPLFNGLIPPDYQLTEYEVLGTTATDRLEAPRISRDKGRYELYPFSFYKGAFKTPTVRNSAETYPYMHNGAFRNLEKLMDFYNRGGGAGLGISVPSQTLPAEPLHLSPGEIKDIIAFLHALTDQL